MKREKTLFVVQGKIVGKNNLLKVVHLNVVNQPGKVGPMGFECVDPTLLSLTGSCQYSEDAYIGPDVIENIPGFNVLVYPVDRTGLLRKKF